MSRPGNSTMTSSSSQQQMMHHRQSSGSSNGHRNGHQQAAPALAPPPEMMEQMNFQRTMRELSAYLDNFQYPYINDVSHYEKLLKIGQGTFGEVFKARCKKTGKLVALKKILMENEKEGFPITALREVKMLQQLKHKNITEIIEVCSSNRDSIRDKTTFYIVFAFCEHDLAGLLKNRNVRLQPVHIKTMMKHLLEGLMKLHKVQILHRDMKAANVLISKEGYLKLADFGLARPFIKSSPPASYTNRVVTLWYRPPELLLGERQYTTKIDVWGAGCIMAEMWTRLPIMQGDTEQNQLLNISRLCGSINRECWPTVEKLPYFSQMELPQGHPRILVKKLGEVIKDDCALALIDKLLTMDPSNRFEAEEAIYHDWFFKDPRPNANVEDLMKTIKESHFELTVARGGPHTNRPKPANNQRSQQNNLPAGQYRDTIF